MAKGYSLNIGINKVDPNHYDNWEGKLALCENDAKKFYSIAKSNNFICLDPILTEDAKAEKIKNQILKIASKVEKGDIVFISYSGHGSSIKDLNQDEKDKRDETWCLYDRQLIDDEIYELLCQFVEGVRVFIVSDCCQSGTAVMTANRTERMFASFIEQQGIVEKRMPIGKSQIVFFKNQCLYENIGSTLDKEIKNKIKASVILISGCQDNQQAYLGWYEYSEFTEKFVDVYNDGAFNGNYEDLRNRIVAQMPNYQTPNYFTVGKENKDFEKQKPFTI